MPEDLSAEEFVPESATEAFDVSVFPRDTGFDEPSVDVQVGEVERRRGRRVIFSMLRSAPAEPHETPTNGLLEGSHVDVLEMHDAFGIMAL